MLLIRLHVLIGVVSRDSARFRVVAQILSRKLSGREAQGVARRITSFGLRSCRPIYSRQGAHGRGVRDCSMRQLKVCFRRSRKRRTLWVSSSDVCPQKLQKCWLGGLGSISHLANRRRMLILCVLPIIPEVTPILSFMTCNAWDTGGKDPFFSASNTDYSVIKGRLRSPFNLMQKSGLISTVPVPVA
jgi:hypothetical protein